MDVYTYMIYNIMLLENIGSLTHANLPYVDTFCYKNQYSTPINITTDLIRNIS